MSRSGGAAARILPQSQGRCGPSANRPRSIPRGSKY